MYPDINFQPTAAMAQEAQKGLAWRKEYGRGGTQVGISRARDLKNNRNLSPQTVRRMASYFARHEADKDAQGFRPSEAGYPSNSRIAWALWGGDPAQQWARNIVGQMNAVDDEEEAITPMGQALANYLQPFIAARTQETGFELPAIAEEIARRVEFEMSIEFDASDAEAILLGEDNCPARVLLHWTAEVLSADKEEMLRILAEDDDCEYPEIEGDDDDNAPRGVPPDDPPVAESAPISPIQMTEESLGNIRTEAMQNGGRKVYAIGLTADMINRNHRYYPASVVKEAIGRLRERMKSSAMSGRAILVAESEHPSDKGQTPNILETVIRWDDVQFDGTFVLLEGTIIPTHDGKQLSIIMDYGVFPRISQRAWGTSELDEIDGVEADRITYLSDIEAYDLVMRPGDLNGAITVMESFNQNGESQMKVDELKKKVLGESGNGSNAPTAAHPVAPAAPTAAPTLQEILKGVTPTDVRKVSPELAQSITEMQLEDEAEADRLKKAADASRVAELEAYASEKNSALLEKLGITETADLNSTVSAQQAELHALRKEKALREVNAYVESEVAATKYEDEVKKVFKEAIKAQIESLGVTTVDEAKGLIATRRREYDAMQSQFDIKAQGYGLKFMGPVLEKQTGFPSYAGASYLIGESLRNRSDFDGWDPRKPSNQPQRLAKMVLDLFDEKFMEQLMAETTQMDEAITVDDLKLPVSVARTVVAEVIPTLVGALVFDVGIAEGGKTTEIYYEKTVFEDGAIVTVPPFAMVSETCGTQLVCGKWIELPHNGLVPDTITVEATGSADSSFTGVLTPYQDYTVDYITGRLWINCDGPAGIAETAYPLELLIGYQYSKFACNDCDEIPQAKIDICCEIVEVCCHRLATDICDDAVIFSQRSLNYDLVNRQLQALVRKIREYLDQMMFYTALASALKLGPGNIVGTWDSQNDSVAELVRQIGLAKVALIQRNYRPDAIITTPLIGDILSNWDPNCCSRPDMLLGDDGMFGRLKGLDLITTNNFTSKDNFIMVVNRDMVHYRVVEPTSIEGPFATHVAPAGGGRTHVVAAKLWFAQECSAVSSPVSEKAALVHIV